MEINHISAGDPVAARLQEICTVFRIPGRLVEYEQITCGHINTTYKVVCESGQGDDKARIPYIAQRVNQYVFNEPVQMMRNIDLVTEHIMSKQPQSGREGRRYRLHYHHTAERRNYYVTPDNEFWRLTNYVDESVGFSATRNPKVLHMVGKAFGQFQAQLVDFDASQLVETIPNFHNTRKRLETLFAHVEEDPCGRCGEVAEEIEFLYVQRDRCSELSRSYELGLLPPRVTHNDTKANNVLLDKDTLEPLVVIDLDTVMPGLAAYDFGDAVRFAANNAAENEPDLSKVSLNLDLYRSFAEGYIQSTANFLTKEEMATMASGALTITVELASRFLDDYITGDRYFMIGYPTENKVRARSQIALAKDMIQKFEEMDRIVRETALKVRG
ncbi:MAG: aminoglycoside phosphotransferase family protein [Oscillospiraceae bacterium]|nr:aminoglycoside phosphotransferase family protein [Oscillospiraceae bacterium]